MTTRALLTSAPRFATAALIALTLMGSLGACGTDQAQEQIGPQTNAAPGFEGEAEVEAFVGGFMKARRAGLPADEFMSAEAKAAYEEHATGLWLYDDTLPGGPGGEYRESTIDEFQRFSGGAEANVWRAVVRISVEWLGDSPPSEMVEVLTIGPGPNVAGEEKPLIVLEAVRSDGPEEGLPLPVAEMRQDIYHTAVTHDYDAVRSLLDPKTFSYSFGESGDPIGYWRRQEEGELPILGDILTGVLHTRFRQNGDIYVWPSAAAKEPAAWTEDDVEGMRKLGYTEDDIRSFEKFGGYTGWRAGIRADGTWLFFLSGD